TCAGATTARAPHADAGVPIALMHGRHRAHLPAEPGHAAKARCTMLHSMSQRLALWRTLPALFHLPLAACPTVDLGETPVSPGACRPDPAYFEEVIWPEFIDTGDALTSFV